MSSVHWLLHSLQHVNYSFAPVSNGFVYPPSYSELYSMDTSNEYQQSIQMFFLIPLEIAAIYIILYAIIAFIYCCYGKPRCIAFNFNSYSSSRRYTDDEHLLLKKHRLKIALSPCAKTTRVILALGVYILIASSIYCAILLDESVNIIGDKINASYEPYKTNIIYGNTIDASLTLTLHNAPSKQQIQEPLIQSQAYLKHYLLSVHKIPAWDSSTEYLTIARSLSQFIIYFGMLISVVLAVCFFMSLFSGTMVKFMSCLTFICILILLVLFAVQFALSINMSDACSNPNNAIIQIANDNNNNKTSLAIQNTVQYYVYCNQEYPYNPLYAAFNDSYQHLLSANKSIYTLVHKNATNTNKYKALMHAYDITVMNMAQLGDNLRCNALYEEKGVVVDALCIAGVSEWFRVYMLQFGLVLLLLIRNCCLCCGLKYQYKLNKKRVMHAQAEYGSLSITSSNNNSFSDYDYHGNQAKYVKYSINSPPQYTNKAPSIGNGNGNGKDHDVDMDMELRHNDGMDVDGIMMYKYKYNNDYEYKENMRNNMIKIYVRRENGKTEYIKMNGASHKLIHDLKQEIQIKYGYPVQTQKIVFNDRLVGCNHRFNEIGIRNGCMVYLQLEDDLNDNDDNFTVEYNGYIELNSYVPPHMNTPQSDIDDEDINDYWSIRIDEWCIHHKSDIIGQNNQIGIICYQYDGQVEWTLNGIKCKSGDVILRNITSLKYCQYDTMYEYIFGVKLDSNFIGNGFRVSKYGKIKLFSGHKHRIGKIELFWIESLVRIYREKGINCIHIEQYQKKNSRYKYDVDKFDCDLCGIDQYIFKERNVYSLLTHFNSSKHFIL